jgi:hypothetical protein
MECHFKSSNSDLKFSAVLIVGFEILLKCCYLAAQSRFAVGNPEKKGLDFSILHDSDDSENRISQLPEGHGNEWKEAPTESVTSKENINMPGKWTREKVRCRACLYEGELPSYVLPWGRLYK